MAVQLNNTRSKVKAEGEKPADAPAPNTEPKPADTGTEEPNTEPTESAEDKAKREKQEAMDHKARIKGIIGSEEAKGREALASAYAFDTDMPVEQALALLKVAPKAVEDKKPTDARQALADAIEANGGNPPIVAGPQGGAGRETDEQGTPTTADSMLAAIRNVGQRAGLMRKQG